MRLPRGAAQRAYWASQRLDGRGRIRARLDELVANESLTASQMTGLQAEKLQATVVDACRHVPYWRRVLDERGLRPQDIDSVEALRHLPITTRAILTEQSDALRSRDPAIRGARWNHSSGSTGARAAFLQDADYRDWMRAHQLRTYQWCGNWRLGDPFALIWGSEIHFSLKSVKDRFDNLLSNRREFDSFLLSPEAIRSFAQRLTRFQPALVSSYSNAIMLVARECAERGIELPELRAVQATSEPLTPGVRAAVQQTFGCEVFDKYGSRETNIVAHESTRHDGMLIQSENVVVEILDDHGEPCAPGVPGRIVLTTLNNRAMPLLRYETADIGAFSTGPTHEGPFRRMESVQGRLQDLITVPGGAALDAYFFSYLMMRSEDVLWFQVVQDEPDRLFLRTYSAAPLTQESQDAIAERIRHHSRFAFRIDFESVQAIPPSPTGKFRLCINNLPDAPRVSDLDRLAVWGDERP